jgi:hypothetical protein
MLRDNAITDAGLKHLAGMKDLVWLQLGDKVTYEGMRKLLKELPKCSAIGARMAAPIRAPRD